MRRGVVYTIVAIALLAVVAFVLRVADSEYDNRRRANESAEASTSRQYAGLAATLHRDSVSEVMLDFSTVHASTTVSKNLRITNATSEPIAILDYETTCRCVSVELPQKAIPAGEYADIDVVFDSRGEYGTVGNYVSLKTSQRDCHVAIWISADVE